MITDLIQIRRLGESNRAENLRFRKWIKSHAFVERQFRRAAEEVHAAIDCRQCAECCRVGEVPLAQRDIERLARFLGIPERNFVEQYIVVDKTGPDATGAAILRRTASGCVFLDGKDCTVYAARPGNCDRFPHLLRGSGSLQSRMWDFVDRATYCPIVFNWMEQVKGLTNFFSGRPR